MTGPIHPSPTIRFVLPGLSEGECAELAEIDLHKDWQVFSEGRFNWTLQTYLELRRREMNVELKNRYSPEAINVAHELDFAPFRIPASAFCVCLRADYKSCPAAQLHVVQNQTQVAADAFWIPHWPQPGLIGRDPGRTGVSHVAIAASGSFINESKGEWREKLSSRGITLSCLWLHDWNDLSTVDVLLGIRGFDAQTYDHKPPSKLFNAWHARIPFVGGRDSAYHQVGQPGRNYIEVTSLEEMLAAVDRLASQPEFYSSLVREGEITGQAYTRERIAECWIRFFEEVAYPEYWRWRGAVWQGRGMWFIGHSQHFARRTLARCRSVLGGRFSL